MSALTIRPVTPQDAAAIAAIYNHYVRETIITFEEVEITAEIMAGRIAAVTATHPWIVGEAEGRLIGYAYAAKYQERSAYRHSALSSIYLDRDACGKGHGTALYASLLERLPQLGFHTVIGGIAIPNPDSLAIHKKLGFKEVGIFAEVGFKFDRWIDVVYVQRTLEAP